MWFPKGVLLDCARRSLKDKAQSREDRGLIMINSATDLDAAIFIAGGVLACHDQEFNACKGAPCSDENHDSEVEIM